MIPFHIIAAIDDKRGIGKGGGLPWHLSGDLKHFREITCRTVSPKKKNAVIMGRKTWESIPAHFRPLPDRINIVLTRNPGARFPEGVLKADSLEKVVELAEGGQLSRIIETIFVIGGQQVYGQAITNPSCDKLYVTHVAGTFDCDAFFPSFEESFEETGRSTKHNEGPVSYHFVEYRRKPKFSTWILDS